jgi:predicted transcriptional regulator
VKISEIVDAVNAEVLCCKDKLSDEVFSACAADMMSDVLAFVKDQAVLVTGLCNPQVIRTAEMMDIRCVLLVRNKRPDAVILELAETKGIVVLSSRHRMFIACGLLYTAGLSGGEHCV